MVAVPARQIADEDRPRVRVPARVRGGHALDGAEEAAGAPAAPTAVDEVHADRVPAHEPGSGRGQLLRVHDAAVPRLTDGARRCGRWRRQREGEQREDGGDGHLPHKVPDLAAVLTRM